jgi:NTE family protein
MIVSASATRRRVSRCSAVALMLFAIARIDAQTPLPVERVAAPAASGRSPRVGLVLSGGSAKGLAHIGVLRVLEQAGVPIDVVTGTSMGSLVGGLYAIGYSPDALEAIVTRLDWNAYFSDSPDRDAMTLDRRVAEGRLLLRFPVRRGRIQLASGVIAGQNISELLARLTWPTQTDRDFKQFPTPFAAVATDLETGAAVPMDSGSLATAMRASMSLSSIFRPVQRDGRTLVDGGVARNLPAQDARALGADFVICSDVSGGLQPATRLHTLVDVLDQTVSFQMETSTRQQRTLCDVLIRPDVSGLASTAFNRSSDWIARGEAAARVALPMLRDLAIDFTRRHSTRPDWTVLQQDAVCVCGLIVRGVEGEAEQLVRSVANVEAGVCVTPDSMRGIVQRVYATGLFDQVTYALERSGSGVVLAIAAVQRSADRLGFGIRYDDRYHTSLLASLKLRNVRRFGTETQFDLRLGEQFEVSAQFLLANARASRVVAGGGARLTSTPLDIFVPSGPQVAQAGARVANVWAMVGRIIGNRNGLALRVQAEHATASASNVAIDTAQGWNFVSAALLFLSDGLDTPTIPTNGTMLYGKSEWATGGAHFSHHVLDARGYYPVHRRLSLLTRATVGLARGGDEVPLHYHFLMGGAYASPVFPESQIAFVGLSPQQMFGSAVQRGEIGVQWEARADLFTVVRVDAGQAANTLALDFPNTIVGAGGGLSMRTPLGPAEVLLSGRRFTALRFEMTIGHSF